MAEIRKVPLNGLTVASTFSGCGGSCLGFRWAGFKHVYANEFTAIARASYEANFPGYHLDGRDIRQVSADDVLEAGGLRVGELDVFEGSPPCQAFSSAGRGAKGWGKIKDQGKNREDLFFEYTRLLRGLKPRAFVAENVPGLVRGAAKGYFIEIMAELDACGYAVECRILDAQWLGVPQARKRTVFVGVRKDVGVPVFPQPLPYNYSIRDAIGAGVSRVRYHRGEVKPGSKWSPYNKEFDVRNEPVGAITKTPETEKWQVFGPPIEKMRIGPTAGFGAGDVYSVDDPAPTLMKGGIAGVSVDQFEVHRQAALPPAYREMWKKLRPGEADEKRFNLVRSDHEQPAQTIVKQGGGGAGITHGHEPRRFTIPELRRLGGFPDDFALVGSFAQQWERVGNSVPPPMMFHVAAALASVILSKKKGKKR